MNVQALNKEKMSRRHLPQIFAMCPETVWGGIQGELWQWTLLWGRAGLGAHITCWLCVGTCQAWCPLHSDTRPFWGFPPQSSWPRAWLVCRRYPCLAFGGHGTPAVGVGGRPPWALEGQEKKFSTRHSRISKREESTTWPDEDQLRT